MKNKNLWLLLGIGAAYYLYTRSKKASATMVQVPVPGKPGQFVLRYGAPGGPAPNTTGMSQNTQNLFNTLQTWINQNPG